MPLTVRLCAVWAWSNDFTAMTSPRSSTLHCGVRREKRGANKRSSQRQGSGPPYHPDNGGLKTGPCRLIIARLDRHRRRKSLFTKRAQMPDTQGRQVEKKKKKRELMIWSWSPFHEGRKVKREEKNAGLTWTKTDELTRRETERENLQCNQKRREKTLRQEV